MPITRPPVLPVWADTGDKTQPSDAELSVGWPVTSIPPSRQRFNWFHNFVANGIRYFARRGLSDYSATETYEIGDRCIGDDGKTYKSLVAANINFAPSTNPTKWERWGFSLSELYAFLLSNHGGDCPATGPASAPSAGAPWTRYTSVAPYLEEWSYFPSGWRVVANFYTTNAALSGTVDPAPTGQTVTTYTAHRPGNIIIAATTQLFETANNPINQGAIEVRAAGITLGGSAGYNATNQQSIFLSTSGVLKVATNDSAIVVLSSVVAAGSCVFNGTRSSFTYIS